MAWWSQVPDGGRTRTSPGESTDIQETDGVVVETTFGRPFRLIRIRLMTVLQGGDGEWKALRRLVRLAKRVMKDSIRQWPTRA